MHEEKSDLHAIVLPVRNADIQDVLELAESAVPADMRKQGTATTDDGSRVNMDTVMKRVFAASAATRFLYDEEDVEAVARLLEEWEDPEQRTYERTRYRERAVRYLETLGMLPESKEDELITYLRNP